jgi:hypothetical protein
MDEERIEDDDVRMPLRTKLIAAAVGAVMVLGAGAVFMRLESPTIAPGQKPPSGHYAASCGLCHSVSADATNIGVQ